MLFRILVQLQRHDLLAVGLHLIVVVRLPQLVLEDPDLSTEDLLPLAADQLVPDLALQLVLEARDIVLPARKLLSLRSRAKGEISSRISCLSVKRSATFWAM